MRLIRDKLYKVKVDSDLIALILLILLLLFILLIIPYIGYLFINSLDINEEYKTYIPLFSGIVYIVVLLSMSISHIINSIHEGT